MKLAIQYSGGSEFDFKLIRLKDTLVKDGHIIVFTYSFKEETYLYNKKHYDFYKDAFDKCEEKNIDVLLLTLDELIDIDILLNELRSRNIKVVFIFSCREIERSEVRKRSFFKLLDNPNVIGAILQSMTYFNPTVVHPKVISGSSLIHAPESKDFNVLYFGRIKDSKGPDILVEAKQYLPKNVKITMAGALDEGYQGSRDEGHKLNILEKGIDKFIPGLIPDIDVPDIFRKADLVVLPYRKLYENGHSTVLVEACEYRKPVVVPNFFPFNEIIKEYKIGKTFLPEDPIDLANVIMSFVKNKYSKYIKFLQKIDDQEIIREILGKIDE